MEKMNLPLLVTKQFTVFPEQRNLQVDAGRDFSIKAIWVVDTQLDKPEVGDLQNKKYLTDITLRHELMHAYFHESGIEGYSENENLVNYLAMSLEKIYAMCEDAGAVKSLQAMRKAA